MTYLIKTNYGILTGSYAELEAAKKAATGFLTSRRTERIVWVVPAAPGTFGGVGLPVATGTKKRTGKVVWVEASKESR